MGRGYSGGNYLSSVHFNAVDVNKFSNRTIDIRAFSEVNGDEITTGPLSWVVSEFQTKPITAKTMNASFSFPSMLRRLPLCVTLCVLVLASAIGTARAQFTISSAWLRIYATDGFGTFDNAGISITPPTIGAPAGTPLTSPVNAISMMSYIYPSPAYSYTPSIGVATAQVNFNAFTWPGSSNYTGVPGALGLVSGSLAQTGVGSPARLRLDWSITYSAAANYSISASAIMTFAGSLGLGDYASFRLHDEYVPVSLATGFSVADNLAGGDTSGIYYISPFWHREDPYTSGAFLDYTAGPPSGLLNVSTGGSFTENGFIDILVDPASVNFEVVPEPATGLLVLLGGMAGLWIRQRRKRTAV